MTVFGKMALTSSSAANLCNGKVVCARVVRTKGAKNGRFLLYQDEDIDSGISVHKKFNITGKNYIRKPVQNLFGRIAKFVP